MLQENFDKIEKVAVLFGKPMSRDIREVPWCIYFGHSTKIPEGLTICCAVEDHIRKSCRAMVKYFLETDGDRG